MSVDAALPRAGTEASADWTGRGNATPYAETGLTYLGAGQAPETVAPWVGPLTTVRGVGTLVHLTTRAQVRVLGEDGTERDTIAARPATVVLGARDRSAAWLVAGPGEPVLEVGAGDRTRPTGLRTPDLAIRSGLVVGDRSAVLVTLDGGLVRWTAGGLDPVALPPGTPRVWTISPGPRGGYLLTHRKGCSVTAVTASFEPVWRFGGVAGNGPDQLSGPEHAVTWLDEVVIADSRNNRLVRLDLQGCLAGTTGAGSVGSGRDQLSYPSSLCVGTSDELLVADSANSRVLAHDPAGTTRRTLWGRPVVRSSRFHYPRSAEPLGGARLVVADSYHHRAVSLDARGAEVESWHEAGGRAFSWPRHAVELDGTLTIVDSRNARLVSVVGGRLRERVLRAVGGARLVHADPHFLRPTRHGFLLSDTYANRVVHVDSAGRLLASWGGDPHHSATHTFLPGQVDIGVKDCHDGVLSEDGMTVWVVDTGQHRVLRVPRGGGDPRAFEVHGDLLDGRPLAYPRSISVLDDHVAIADAGNHRVLVCEVATGRTVWTFGGTERGLSTSTLDDPRFVRLARGDGGTCLTVVDYGNHRLLRWVLRLPGAGL